MVAFTPDAATRNQLTLSWGVESHVTEQVGSTDEMVLQVDRELLNMGDLAEGDTVIVTAGSPPGVPGNTNMVQVHHLGTRADV